jgi:hypothetical protein
MKKLTLLLSFTLCILFLQCGSSDLEEGDAQYAEGKYTQAINKYLAYKKSNPGNTEINSKLALAYFSKGKQLFDKTRNLETFIGNYKNSLDYLPEKFATSEENKQFSQLLLAFAKAYRETKPNNEIQREEYFNNTLEHLGQAVNYDPDNTEADELIDQIYAENFQKMYDTGLKNYNDAKKRKDPDLYLKAERYLKRAVEFNNSHEDALNLLNTTRKQTLSILEADYPLSFCIPAYKIDKTNCFVAIAMQNFSDAPINVNLNALKITTTNGDVISADLKKTAELEKALSEKAELKTNTVLNGQVIFTLPANAKPEQISYTHNDEKTFRKYFAQ